MPAATGLATPDFWEDEYLSGVELPARPDLGFSFDRALAEALRREAAVAPGAKVLEIGCAPAKWLGFYAEHFGARVEGIEYTSRGAELSRANLAALGIDGLIHQADFFTHPPRPFDLVLSLGFIEHFDDLESTFSRHAEFVAPGGVLVVGVPNYRGLIGAIARWANPAHVDLHNRRAMDPALYRRLGRQVGLSVSAQFYLDGPDPNLIKPGRRSALPAILALTWLRRLEIADRLNHRLLSAYLLTVLCRP